MEGLLEFQSGGFDPSLPPIFNVYQDEDMSYFYPEVPPVFDEIHVTEEPVEFSSSSYYKSPLEINMAAKLDGYFQKDLAKTLSKLVARCFAILWLHSTHPNRTLNFTISLNCSILVSALIFQYRLQPVHTSMPSTKEFQLLFGSFEPNWYSIPVDFIGLRIGTILFEEREYDTSWTTG
ncbi:hypothetical protein RND81_12G010200 [Saponaria officinalis]|uniref:Uncharacterized protein n=1 Tax=Saponaria officinalis TaxID=3572 RepID=A0AAW1H500_SAPOF